jgi:membrane protease YdiL (CAAX protease family)
VLVRAHPVGVFFLLSCLLSWACWGLGSLVGGEAAALLDLAAPFGPAVAALVVTALAGDAVPGGAQHVRSPTVRRPWWWVVVLLALAVVALRDDWRAAFAPDPDVGRLLGLTLLSVLPPLAFSLWWRLHRGRPGPVSWHSPPLWLLVALLLFPVVGVLGTLASGGPGELGAGSAWPTNATTILLVLVTTAIYGGPLGEELGWRGFALPHLQQSRSPLMASVVVGLAWGFWHLPLHLRGDYGSMGGLVTGFGLRLVSQVAVAVVFTWLFNRSHHSLVAVVVLHASLNNTVGFWLPESLGFQVGVGLLATAAVFVDRMYERPSDPTGPSEVHEPPSTHRRVRRSVPSR